MACNNPLAVPRKGNRADRVVRTLLADGEQLLAAGRIPHSSCPTEMARYNPLAVRGKGCRPNSMTVFEGEQWLAAGCLPYFGRSIKTASDNPLAVRRKSH